MGIEIVVLAAGQGTRMCSNTPKILHHLAGKPLLAHVLKTATALAPEQIHVVYGHQSEKVREAMVAFDVNWVYQAEQLGTGHAVMQALPHIAEQNIVLVLSSDVPLITQSTLSQLLNVVPQQGIGILTAEVVDPSFLGRVIRDDSGNITKIVEHKDASESEQAIHEIYSGIMAAKCQDLLNWLPKLDNDNAQKEYYLTEAIQIAVAGKYPVLSVFAACQEEVQGVNDRIQLATLERHYQRTQARRFMREGVTILDPERFDVRGEVDIAGDVILDVNVVLEGRVIIGSNSQIGPNVVLRDVEIGENVVVSANTVIEESVIGDDCSVGPFARIRPGTCLARGAKVGNFVEVKKSVIGPGSKINHLSYVGDATLGAEVNVGAGTITCNYDGYAKHSTLIGDGAHIGSNTALVAPVSVGEHATIGAGSVVTKAAPAGKLTLARSKQETIENWVAPKSQKAKIDKNDQ